MPGQSTAGRQGNPESLESILDRFELRWKKGEAPPDMEDFVPSVALHARETNDERRELLQELVKVDLEYRWRSRSAPSTPFPNQPLIEDYVKSFPGLGPLHLTPIEMIAEEYRVRQRWGDRPGHAEYLKRFPTGSGRLKEALALVDAELAAEYPNGMESSSSSLQGSRSDQEPLLVGDNFHHSTIRLDALADAFEPGPRPPASPVGRFQIKDLLGSGAFGSVWRAYDPEMRREVAVKMPRAGHFFTREEEERFLREARCAGQLNHPGIVGVHDVGRSQGTFFIVSELVRGVNLGEIALRRRLDFVESARLIAEVADALDYAHQQGVIHRDIKPSNILLEVRRKAEPASPEGVFRPRLTDFGLALRNASEVTMTQDGQVLGTPAYMSPEQVRNPHAVDGRSDIYSLGVVLYELLTGEVPFRGVSRMVLLQVTEDEPRSLRLLNDQIPRDLETICLRCLQKDAKQRYASARALAADLRRWLAGEPIQARAIGKLERSFRWARRNPAWIALGALAALAFVTLTGAVAALILIVVSAASVGFGLLKTKQAAEASQLAADADRDQKRFAAAFQLSIKQYCQARDEKDKALAGETLAREQFKLVWRFVQKQLIDASVRPNSNLLLQEMLNVLDVLSEKAEGDALFLLDLAAAYERIGDLQKRNRDFTPRDDLSSYRKSLEVFDRLARLHPENAMTRQETARLREKIRP